jgi:hypothetical protein
MYTHIGKSNNIHIKEKHRELKEDLAVVTKALPAGSHQSQNVLNLCCWGGTSLQTGTSSFLQGKQIQHVFKASVFAHKN